MPCSGRARLSPRPWTTPGPRRPRGGVTEETYATLRQQNEQLVQQLAAAEEQRLENERLRGLLNLRDTYEITGVSGRVIGRTTDAWNRR